MTLRIEPDFKNLIPPLTEEERQQLEDSIVQSRHCRDALVVWGKTIVDGHNRYEICRKHNEDKI